jgi:glycosyltransferase involved in cell wall biosynthesis
MPGAEKAYEAMILSIITINYNNAIGLAKTIDSVLGQAKRNFEYIVIDGGSTDGSVDVLKDNGARLDYWISEVDGGIYCAMNKGIKAASGEYCLFLNSGDRLNDLHVTGEIERQLACGSDLVVGRLIFDGGSGSHLPKATESLFGFLADYIPHPSTFIKRELFRRIGYYDESYGIISDFAFFYRAIIENRASCAMVDYPVTVFDMDGISTRKSDAKDVEHERFLSEKFSAFQIADFLDYRRMRAYGDIESCLTQLDMIRRNGGARAVRCKLAAARVLDPLFAAARGARKLLGKVRGNRR